MLGAGLVTQSRLTPRGDRAGTADRGLAFTTTVRVIARVHDGTANLRSPAHVALAAGLTDLLVGVVDVTDLTDGGHAVHRNVAHFGGGQADHRQVAFLRHQLRQVRLRLRWWIQQQYRCGSEW